MKLNIQKIQPFVSEDNVYHADTCLPLVDAIARKKLKFKALARYTYPGDRLTSDTKGISSIGYWDADEPQDWGLNWHRNEGIEIHYLESGTMPYSQGGETLNLSPGKMTVTRPWEEHKVGAPFVGMGKFYWVILDLGVRRPHQNWVWPDWIMLTENDLNRLTNILRHDDNWLWKGNRKIANCFKRLGNVVDSDKSGSNASKIRVIINDLLISILELLDADEIVLNESLTDSSRSVEQFLRELENKLSDNWTIEEMAESAGVGLTRFTHHCKKITNLTPMRYLAMKRIEMAKVLLVENEKLSVADVAYSCGFATGQYFSTVFKRHEKMTPLEFRTKSLAMV